MRYKWLLFDVDNTLLDFTKASKDSLFKSMEDFNLHCNDEIYSIYKKENAAVWGLFEENMISAIELRSLRFKNFFSAVEILHTDPLEFNTRYLENLVAVSQAYEGVIDLIESLRTDYKTSIITNGLKEAQRPRLQKLNMTHLFDSIIVSDEIGVSKPDISFFEHAYNSIPNPPPKSDILVIGDSLKSDIQGGINFGVDTCYIDHGNLNISDITPTHTISSVFGLKNIL